MLAGLARQGGTYDWSSVSLRLSYSRQTPSLVSGIDVWQSMVLGVVEGLTEFLPVSSTAHLRIVEGLMGIDVADNSVVGFTAVVQVGAIAAVLIHFGADIAGYIRAWCVGLVDHQRRTDPDYRFAWWVIWATIPVVVVGLLAKPLIDGPLASLWVVVASLVLGSGYMWVADRTSRTPRRFEQARLGDALAVGASQMLALLLPGFSRSGATISTGLLVGLDRVGATRISFLLSIPTLTGAGIYELKDAMSGNVGLVSLAVGTVVSFVVAYGTIGWLLRFVARHDFRAFVGYRLLLAAALSGLLAVGVV